MKILKLTHAGHGGPLWIDANHIVAITHSEKKALVWLAGGGEPFHVKEPAGGIVDLLRREGIA